MHLLSVGQLPAADAQSGVKAAAEDKAQVLEQKAAEKDSLKAAPKQRL